MTDGFNSKAHKFGGAYQDNLCKGHIVYPVRASRDEPDDVMAISLSGDYSFTSYEFAELTRAPDHDLIPVVVADKLYQAMNSMIEDLKMRIDATGKVDGYKDGEDFVFPWGNSVMHKIDEAMDRYEQHRQRGE